MKQIFSTTKQSLHEEVLEILPWFVNNSLGDKERIKVMTHLSDCSECRKERDQLQQLQRLVQKDDQAQADYQPAFKNLMRRIDAAEQDKQSTAEVFVLDTKRRWPNAPMHKYGLAASLLLACAGLFLLSGGISEPVVPAKDFTTLNVATAPVSDVTNLRLQRRYSLEFETAVSNEQQRAAFIDRGAYIVSGPDEAGRFVVEITVPAGTTDDEMVHSISAIDGVKYAAVLR